jgi:hypothetical protein
MSGRSIFLSFASSNSTATLQPYGVITGRRRLGEAAIQRSFDRWMARIPTPLGLAD